MPKDKIFDDLANMANGFAGLANDALKTARQKADDFQKSMKVGDEIEALHNRIDALEKRIALLEDKKKAKGKTSKWAPIRLSSHQHDGTH